MSHHDVQNHFNDKAAEQMSSVLGTLMEIVKSNPNIKLTQEQENILTSKKDDVQLSSKSIVEIYRGRLSELWQKFRPPIGRKAEVEASYDRWVKEQRKKIRNVKVTRDNETSAQRAKRAEEEDEEFLDNLIEPIKMEGKICYGIDLKTLTIDYTRPLQFCDEIKLDLIQDCVQVSPLTKLVDINKTLRKILTKGEIWGWTRQNIATLLKLFVKDFLPISYTCLAYLEEPTDIWEAVSNLIDFSSAETTILQAMKALRRKKGHGIMTVVGSYRSLSFDLHEIKSPYASKEECVIAADKDSVKIVKWFIEPNLASLLKGVTDKLKYEQKRRIEVKEIVDLVNKYEMSPEYKLKGDKSLDRFDLSQVSIFLCDSKMPSSHKEPTEEVFTANESSENFYESVKESTSPLKKDSSRYGSTSSISSSHNSDNRSRGRSPHVKSPFTERKRLYIRGRGGERRSISRNKLEVYDDKSKKFVPRPLSRSRDRSKSATGRCLLCNIQHPGICHYYGSINPTKEPCEKCGGKHPVEICKGKRIPTPKGSRTNSQTRDESRETPKTNSEGEKPWFPAFKKKTLN